MKKFYVGVLLVVVMMVILMIIPHSPLGNLILNQLKMAVEKNWKSEITYSNASIHVLKGELAFNALKIQTSKDVSPRWSLDIKNVAVDIDFLSWFSDNVKLNKLIIKDIFFSRHETKRPDSQIERMFSKTDGKTGKEKEYRKIEKTIEKGILIKHLIIQGKFELETVYGSGKSDTVKIESFSVNKKDILFDGRPDVFVSSLLKRVP